ncbi:hypothetical protein F4823DRAFT_293715 [Ustulina deusta]|nr:hypothetical protein F4823DRAFT_293715 [Ustulina deusta]
MSSTRFQKYLEGMNRQPLDKKPGNQSSSVLLPHQRPGPAQGLTSRSPNISEQQTGHDAFRRDVVEALSDVSTDNAQPNKYSSPKHTRQLNVHQNKTPPGDQQSRASKLQLATYLQSQNPAPIQQHRQYESPQKVGAPKISPRAENGLAKSRWADPAYNGTSASKIGQAPNIFSMPVQSQQRTAVGKQAVTPVSKDTDASKFWTPDKKHTSVQNETVVPKLESNAFTGQNRSTCLPNPSEPNCTQGNGWDEMEDVRNPTGVPGLQPLKAAALVQTARENSQASKKSTSSLSKPPKDPRANWPTESGVLGDVDQNVAIQDQDRASRSHKSSDEMSSSTEGEKVVPRHIINFIEIWRRGAHSVEADFLSQSSDLHEDCDVDTYEGVLMRPVEYPTTKQQELMSRNQLEMTSALHMRQLIAETARRDPKRKAQRKAEKKAKIAARAAAAAAEPDVTVEEHPNLDEVQIPCHLRPAVESDIEAIAAIYNQEIADGYKVMDTMPVGQDDFAKIYSQCLAEKMPFIVAVEGWYDTMEMNIAHQEVIGFALVTAVSRGIAGSYETLSRCGGKLLVIVKPEFRRKKIGTALIDIIITNCTGWYMSKCRYQFVNLTHGWISREFGSNSRKWWYLEMEVMIRSAEDENKAREGDEFQWIWNFLETKFTLLLKNYDEKCFYQPHKMHWLDKLTFRRDCRTRGE